MSQIITTTLLFAATALVALLGFIGSAFAAQDTDLEMKLNTLNAEQVKGRLVINYTISKASWKAARRVGITPQLNVYTGKADNFRYSFHLAKRRGTLELPRELKLKSHKRMQVSLVGFSGYYHIARTSLGERCAELVSIPIMRSRGKRHAPRGNAHPQANNRAADVIRACKAAVSSHKVGDCIELANTLPRPDALPVVQACGAETQWDSEFTSCMKSAKKLQHAERSATIEACGAATQWNSELKSCLEKSARYGHSPVRNIKACDANTTWNSNFNKCLVESKSLGRRAGAVIRACGEGTRFDSDFHDCLQSSALGRQRG